MYAIVRCTNKSCGRFSYCKVTQKTKKCPYCNRQLRVPRTKVFVVNTPEQARKLVQDLNTKLGKLVEPEWMSKAAPEDIDEIK